MGLPQNKEKIWLLTEESRVAYHPQKWFDSILAELTTWRKM